MAKEIVLLSSLASAESRVGKKELDCLRHLPPVITSTRVKGKRPWAGNNNTCTK
jgi:hypothetical protein